MASKNEPAVERRARKKASRARPRRGSRRAPSTGPKADDATGRTRDWRSRAPATAGRPRAVADWIAAELAEQERRYRKIVREMEALERRRQLWIREFYRRIQDTGFYVHADVKRRIPAEAIPPLPKRVKVVY